MEWNEMCKMMGLAFEQKSKESNSTCQEYSDHFQAAGLDAETSKDTFIWKGSQILSSVGRNTTCNIYSQIRNTEMRDR